jgi:geranylgeranyl pyrophosphate synthase
MPAAISVEIAMAAADLIDEISDEDPSLIITRYGLGQALNTANLMLVMAQQILLRNALQEGGEGRQGENRTLLALGALQEMLVEAAVGQHLDMLYQGMGIDQVTVEMSGEMTAKKAGALIGGACRMGALMAGANPQVVELITRFGREIGGIAQLKNDLRDVLPPTDREIADATYQPKTDLRLRKRTIPIVFALHDDSPEPNLLQRVFNNQAEGADEEEMRQAVVSAGGTNFAQLVMDIHLQNASQALQELESLQPGAHSILAHLLHSFDERGD